MDVLEQQGEGSVAIGDLPQRVHHLLEEREPRLRGIHDRGGRLFSLELGRETLERRRVLRRRAARAGTTDRTEDLDPGPERRCAADLGAPAPRDGEAAIDGAARQLGDEARLSDPTLAGDHVQAAAPGRRSVEALFQLCELRGSADDRPLLRHFRLRRSLHDCALRTG